MHGNHLEKGTLEGDHFKYTGEFKDNKFDGRGVEELKDTHQRFEGIY